VAQAAQGLGGPHAGLSGRGAKDVANQQDFDGGTWHAPASINAFGPHAQPQVLTRPHARGRHRMIHRRHLLQAAAALASPGLARSGPPLRILVLGGTGYLGPALVRAALRRGHVPTLFNRGLSRPRLFSDLERRRGDRAPERGDGLRSLRDGRWDAVVDVAAYYPRHVEATAALLRSRVERYVVVSSIAVYSDWTLLGMTEQSPVRVEPPRSAYAEAENLVSGGSHYGGRKRGCELAAQAQFGERFATVRATGIIGADIEDDDPNKFYWPARLVQGRPILAPHDGRQMLQSIDVRDLSDFVLHLIETDQMGVFNAIGPEQPFSTAAYVEAARKVTGGTAPVVWSGRGLGSYPMSSDSPAFAAFDPSRARAAGLRYRHSLEDSIRANWNWFRGHYPAAFDFAAAGYGPSLQQESEGLATAGWKPG
jgi:2'-hydroxyisoflavone reductase